MTVGVARGGGNDPVMMGATAPGANLAPLRALVPFLLTGLILHALPAAARGSQAQEITERTLRVDGTTVRALCSGARPRVLLLHDEGSTADGWRPVLRRLEADGVAACAYDRRGSGSSGRAPEHRGWYELMDEMRRIHASLGASPGYVLAGHGLGGLYARLFAAGRPTDVGGLVLVDPVHEDMPRRARPGVPDEAWAEWMRRRQRPNADGLVEARVAERARGARLPSLPVTVVTPTRLRVPSGWDARFVNEAARQVHASILQGVPGGRHVPARGSGSAVHVEDPELVADEIARVVEARASGTRSQGSQPFGGVTSPR